MSKPDLRLVERWRREARYVYEDAEAAGIEEVVVLGITKDGRIGRYTNMSAAPDIVWLLEHAKLEVMKD